MGILADFFVATPDQALRYANRRHDPDEGEEIQTLLRPVSAAPGSFLRWTDAPAHELTDYLLRLAGRIDPKRVSTATNKRRPRKPKEYADASQPGAHVSTARVLKQAREKGP